MKAKRILIMASGDGSTFEHLVNASRKGQINAEVCGLVVDRPCGAVKRAIDLRVDCLMVQPLNFATTAAWAQNVEENVFHIQPDLIVLAGFLRKLSHGLTEKFAKKIINVHPALLPKFGGKGMYGANVHKAVSQSGDTKTGATVHFVNEHYDQGQIIAQETVEIVSGEDAKQIENKVKQIEKQLLLKTIQSLIS